MNKKILLLASAAILTLGTFAAATLTYERESNNLVYTGATSKSFTFDGDVGRLQFPNTGTESVVQRSVVTGVSSNIETSVSYKNSSNVEQPKRFGYGVYFITNQNTGDVLNEPAFHFEFGVNNATSATVDFGLIKSHEVTTTASKLSCNIQLYRNGYRVTGSSGSNKDWVGPAGEGTFDWTKDQSISEVGDKVVIDVKVFSGNFDSADLFYVKSITLNWAC